MLKFKLFNENATIPTRGTEGSAGYDLYATERTVLWGYRPAKLPTGVGVMLPPQHTGLICNRSGLAFNYGIYVLGTFVIDEDYRGEIKVALFNMTENIYTIEKGDRIAQMVVTPYNSMEAVKVSNLDNTERGDGGFGSTGK